MLYSMVGGDVSTGKTEPGIIIFNTNRAAGQRSFVLRKILNFWRKESSIFYAAGECVHRYWVF